MTPSCHQILLCSGQGEQASWEGRALCWRGQCRFLANAQACWRQGGVLITGCMHFVKCRAINLGNYPSIPHPPALLYLPSLSRGFLIKQTTVSLRAKRGRSNVNKHAPGVPDGLTKNIFKKWWQTCKQHYTTVVLCEHVHGDPLTDWRISSFSPHSVVVDTLVDTVSCLCLWTCDQPKLAAVAPAEAGWQYQYWTMCHSCKIYNISECI